MGIDNIIFYIFIFILGSAFGSFACCQAWRIHEAKSGKKLGSRSVCMSCNHKLAWYDNIPVLSWLFLRGKCHYCKAKIGIAEILAEISLGAAFVLIAYKYTCAVSSVSELFITASWGFFVPALIIMTAMVVFWILLIYDAKWGELPVLLMLVAIIFAVLYQFSIHGDPFRIFIATGLLAGIYYLLYFFSKEKLVGGGDWILCISVAIFLGRFEFAIIELFLANFFASIAGIPQILKKDKKPIPFGPFLIVSLLIILLTSDQILKFLVLY